MAPKLWVLFWVTIVVRADHQIELVGNTGLGKLQCKTGAVGVGDEHSAFAFVGEKLQELLRLWPLADARTNLAFEGQQIHVDQFTPVVQAVPVERTACFIKPLVQLAVGLVERDAAVLGVALG